MANIAAKVHDFDRANAEMESKEWRSSRRLLGSFSKQGGTLGTPGDI